MRIGILTISDRVSSGEMEDRGGPAIEAALAPAGAESIETAVVPDDREQIAEVLRRWADRDRLDIVFTTGGTGLGPRDVTPEATRDVAEREVPGIAEGIRIASLAQTPHAMLSRGLAVIRGRTLIVNLPGSPGGAGEGVDVVLPVLSHAVAIMGGGKH